MPDTFVTGRTPRWKATPSISFPCMPHPFPYINGSLDPVRVSLPFFAIHPLTNRMTEALLGFSPSGDVFKTGNPFSRSLVRGIILCRYKSRPTRFPTSSCLFVHHDHRIASASTHHMSTSKCRVIMSLIHTPSRPSMPILRFASRQMSVTGSRTEEGDMTIQDPGSAARSNFSDGAYRTSVVSPDGNHHYLKQRSVRSAHPDHPAHSETHSPVQSEYASGDRGIRLEYRCERLPPPPSTPSSPGLQLNPSSSVISFHTHPHDPPHAQHNTSSGSNVDHVQWPRGRKSADVASLHVHSHLASPSQHSHPSIVVDIDRHGEDDHGRPVSNDGISAPSPELEDQALIQRLHTILDEVHKVLRTYTSTLNPSARRVQVLYAFYDRVYDLIHPPSPDPYSSRSQPRSRAGIQSNFNADQKGGEGRGGGLSVSHVEELEREWWESEIVAAWYGPISPTPNRPRPCPCPSTLPMVPVGPGPGPGSSLCSPRPGVEASTSRRVDGTYTPGVVGDRKGREEAIKRDASFVGLYDE